MNIACIRDENKTSGHFRNYNISDLLDKVDIVLSEHGFVREENRIDSQTGGMYCIYKGLSGEAVVRFATEKSKLIPLFLEQKEVARCPIYVEQRQIPDLIEKSILNDLEKI